MVTDTLATLLESAMPISVVVVAIVAALKANLPVLQGWRTLAVSGFVSAALAGVLIRPTTGAAAWDAIAIAVLAWAVSVGGDSWVARIATKAKLSVITDISSTRKGE